MIPLLTLLVLICVATTGWALYVLADRRHARAALHESQRTYATLLSHLPGMAYRCRTDDARTLTFASAGSLALTGYEPEALLARDAGSFAALVHPADRPGVVRQVVAASEAGRPFQLVYRLRTASGAERWVWEQGSAVRQDGVTVVEGFITDITEMKHYETALVDARRQAEEMNRLKSAFLSNISHEIRTPLTSIIGFSSLLADEVDEEQRELVGFIEQSGQRLLDTLNTMIDLSLIEAGSLELHPELLNVCDEAEAIVDRMQTRAAAKGLRLRFLADAPAVWAHLDPAYLERILQKLIDNAIKFTERGHVTVGVHPQPERVEIRVEDTGIGISEAFLPHVFAPFKQESTGSTRAYEGSGLGLALTKQLMDLLGGTIAVTSCKGRGSTFTLSFPRAHDAAATNRHRPFHGSDFAAGQMRALVIDPNPLTPSYLGLLLGSWCTVTTVPNEQAALRSMNGHRFDIVLVNIDAQDSAGLELLERLRTTTSPQHVAVVALTASPFVGEQSLFLDAGFDGYIGLPFPPQAFAPAQALGLR